MSPKSVQRFWDNDMHKQKYWMPGLSASALEKSNEIASPINEV
jgi:hypothetical protein